MFTCTIIVANQRTHSLNNTISSQIKEGLELIVGTKNKHIRLGICSQIPFNVETSSEGSAKFNVAGMPTV